MIYVKTKIKDEKMLIQPIQNQNSYTIPKATSTSFKGDLGYKVMEKVTENGVLYNKLLPSAIKTLGLSFLGMVSVSKLKDILETFIENINVRDGDISNRDHEIEDLQKLIIEKEKDFEERTKEQNIKIDAKLAAANDLAVSAENRNKILDERAKNLEKLEADKDKAYNMREAALNKQFEEKFSELEKRELNLKEKEQTLISTENLIRQAEADKIVSAARALYGIKNPDVRFYESIAEQLVNVVSILNSTKFNNSIDPQEIAICMRNNEGVVSVEMMQYFERITKLNDKWTQNDLCRAIELIKDGSGNFDIEKSTHLISLLSWKDNDINTVIKKFEDYYINEALVSNDSGQETYKIHDETFGEILLPKDKYVQYIKLKDRLKEVESKLKSTTDSRDIANKAYYDHSKTDNPNGIWSSDRDGIVENTNKYAKEISDLTGEAAGLKERLKHLLSIYKNNHI